MFTAILDDLRFALRSLRRQPAFATAAIAMLALAIGLNVCVFTVVNAMLFRGFPLVRRNNRLVYIQERKPSGTCCIAYTDFADWRSQSHSFEDLAFIGGRRISFGDGQTRPTDMSAATLTANAFRLLGVAPVLGRDFHPSDEGPGAPPVVILNYRFWVNRFSKRADIIGHVVRIDDAPAIVIGIMPDGFDFPDQRDLWLPLLHTPEMERRGFSPGGYMAFGRLRDGVTLPQARAELQVINRRLALDWPATNRDVVPSVGTYSQVFVGPDAPVIYGSLWAAALFC